MLKQNYYVSYTVLLKTSEKREFRTFKASPVMALNEFHRAMQRTKEVDAKRKVIRPRLKPDQYKINGMYIQYPKTANELPDAEMIKSYFDLPDTPNPDLNFQTKRIKKADRPKPPKPPEFPFMNEQPELKLL